MKNSFQATFSTGEVFTRNSHHCYISASAYVNKETGEIRNVTFSSKEKSSPGRGGVFYHPKPRRADFRSLKAFNKCLQTQKELEKIWSVETVKLIQL